MKDKSTYYEDIEAEARKWLNETDEIQFSLVELLTMFAEHWRIEQTVKKNQRLEDLLPIKANHITLGKVDVVGFRIESLINNNKMYLVKSSKSYLWVYDYEVEILKL